MQTEVIRLTTEELDLFYIQREEDERRLAYEKMPKWKKKLLKLISLLGGRKDD